MAYADPRHDPGSGKFPDIALPGILRGEEAIRQLADRLPAVAQLYGHTPDRLRAMFRSDSTLHVDETGRLLYIEGPLPAGGDLLQEPALASATAFDPVADTFRLHSRPGAKRKMYLDFNGHILTGTAWNSGRASSINCPPWDIDGNPSVFGETERRRIYGIWQRVAEDYRPFDVDVTTELIYESDLTRSSDADDTFGTRVLISPISSYFGNYGGIAYVGVFDYVGDYYKPALVFPENLANGEKYIAEAISHEAGHNLGLSHDGATGTEYYAGYGSGATGWAPIMGNGYYKDLTQWSKGEYANANNREDDLVVIRQNGLWYRADDYGNTLATAAALPATTGLNVTGVIEQNTDLDVFSFSAGAGSITINVTPAYAGNLDVFAELLNASGTTIAASNPLTLLGASISATVATAGKYYLRVSGGAKVDPSIGYSNYGSLGEYTVSGTIPAGVGNQPPVASMVVSPSTSVTPYTLLTFDASGSTDPESQIASYAWNFGDGPGATGATVQRSYSVSGFYDVSVTVTDVGGLTAVASTRVTVNRAPVAVISWTVSGLTVNFSGTSSSDPDGGTMASYAWNFGNGSTGSGATVAHTYPTAGTYTVTLKVTDALGGTGTTTQTVTVTQDVTPVPYKRDARAVGHGNAGQ
jgi:chitodextrinase